MLKATKCDLKVNGKTAYRVPVEVKLNSSVACATLAEFRLCVIAHSTVDAANWVRACYNRPETEIIAYGPQGGKTYRYIGWESAIWAEMCNRPTAVQGKLF